MFLLRLSLGLAVAIVLASPMTSFAASVPGSCSQFVDTYLRAGRPSGSTADVQLELRGVSPSVIESTLTLDYAPYPAVAGRLTGPGVELAVDSGALQLSLTIDDTRVELAPHGCIGSTLLYATTEDALVTLALR
jgi:hypothetical protein